MDHKNEKTIGTVLTSANVQMNDGLYVVGEYRGVDTSISKKNGNIYTNVKVLVGDVVMKLNTPAELLMSIGALKNAQRVLVSYRDYVGQFGTNHNLASIESL